MTKVLNKGRGVRPDQDKEERSRKEKEKGRKWNGTEEGRRKEEGGKSEKGERGDVVIPPRPL